MSDILTENDRVFIDPTLDGPFEGGIYYRDFDLVQFLGKVEAQTGKKVCGIAVDGNNLEIFYR